MSSGRNGSHRPSGPERVMAPASPKPPRNRTRGGQRLARRSDRVPRPEELLVLVVAAVTATDLSVVRQELDALEPLEDRKSTRLNSSHVASSYAVFCLKKKRHKQKQIQ